jgi:hypothetical protein
MITFSQKIKYSETIPTKIVVPTVRLDCVAEKRRNAPENDLAGYPTGLTSEAGYRISGSI